MPSAGPDPALVARFRADLERTGAAPGARLGIALSGGPDSLALLILAAATGPLAALTVDHGLRADSAAEAGTAGAVARSLGVPHTIARVSVASGGEGLQGEARRARYAALGDWARREGLAAVLTAHHADDQAETMLMRLSRGAGLAGLTGIRATRPLDEADPAGPWLLRPLLAWRKAELEAIVAAAGIVPARDPSNHAERFDRTGARVLLAGTPWLDPLRLAASASHLRDADAALDWMTDRLVAQIVEEADGTVSIPTDVPVEILRRGVVRLLADRFGKSPDGPSVTRAMMALSRGETVTVSDVLARADGGRWRFRAAPPRRSA